MLTNKNCVLTIAGSDSSGGAGIQADIKTISATGCYAASVVTALTAQNTMGVQAIENVSPDFIKQQLESVFSDLTIAAVKIGMLHHANVITEVASALKKYQPRHVVLDPVMMSKNGCALMDADVVPLLGEMIFPYVTLITPNLIEAESLLGRKIETASEQASAALQLSNLFKVNVLIKGGHFEGKQSSDVVYLHQDASCFWFHAERINSKHTHGTGCSLSAAIASFLAQGYSLRESISRAKIYLTKAIEFGAVLKIGQGCGPLDHFYFLEKDWIA